MQATLPLPAPDLPPPDPDGNYGAVFTKRWIVEFILDLCGYDTKSRLWETRLVEPACGDGAFLGPVVERLLRSCAEHAVPASDAKDAIRAFDVQPGHVHTARHLVKGIATSSGIPERQAQELAEAWIQEGDFLLMPHEEDSVDVVVGNPPYIRLEDVSNERMALYQSVCTTMSGRADIYLGFFEMGLRLLRKEGVLGFICADRWMRNSYGRKLRRMVVDGYSVEAVIEMHDVDAFANEVAAYPAITVLSRRAQGRPLVATTTSRFDEGAAGEVLTWADSHPTAADAELAGRTEIARLDDWFDTETSWPTGSPQRLALLRDLEDRFGPIERDKTKIGIGVATGADDVFITRAADIEEDRLIPLVMTSDITSGTVKWGGHYLVNPWRGPGELVDLGAYPKLASYFQQHAGALRRRHVAGKQPERWYRTIDPVHLGLTTKPKLLFPDMKMFAHPVLEDGNHYPHHNLYYVISEDWELDVLGGLLLSKVAQFFIESYAVRMRGGTLRFQAQYLRRIRVPDADALTSRDRRDLRTAFKERDVDLATAAALRAYGIDHLPD